MKQIERLLVLQGQRCFFCNGRVPDGEASVEHLVASANGGRDDDSNCVVCCKTLNTVFGSQPVKNKLQAVLNHRGPFICPRKGAPPQPPPKLVDDEDEQMKVVVADLQRRGSAKPGKEKALRNTMAAAFKKKPPTNEISALLARLKAKGFVSISGGKVTYDLPANGSKR